ncbi:phosphotransferase enzyme family protein [Nonomuraea africana]|uniref:Ser/Thr protein kinase RdoA (MazF antagonist) n=1 Tax=Nonomuraea africana TaxID=46171 RepID=A0ABR9KNS9_9ACTN|nr:phosphotransferase [Nonomuraea africana]MBE1563691.1 Ser/Thr protein kinase RdoA (MazF antagonist) [Nonomuraea africana]
MIYANIPLTPAIRRAVTATWGTPDDEGVRLHGGEESAAYLLGGHVVRVGPEWRTTAAAEWCHAIARRAADALPEAVAPVPTPAGGTVIRVDGRPVSLWPYVEGAWPGSDLPDQRVQGARLLAGLHAALADVRPGPRPVPAFQEEGLYGTPSASPEEGRYGTPPADTSELADPALDLWLAAFHREHPRRHPLHGDFYPGNTLARNGTLVAVLDWDEAFVGAPEVELAAAAFEWGDDDLGQSKEFVDAYLEAGGTAAPLTEEELVQLIRHKLRREFAYFQQAVASGVVHDAEDLDYHELRVALFHELAG